jgi:hypothetical protein
MQIFHRMIHQLKRPKMNSKHANSKDANSKDTNSKHANSKHANSKDAPRRSVYGTPFVPPPDLALGSNHGLVEATCHP